VKKLKIRYIRENLGLSQAKLSLKSGVSQTYISELELGKKQPTLPIISKIADALGVSIEKLLEDDEEPITAKYAIN